MSASKQIVFTSLESEGSLINMDDLETDDTEWLVRVEEDSRKDSDWLRKDLESSYHLYRGNENSLLRKLEHISKGITSFLCEIQLNNFM